MAVSRELRDRAKHLLRNRSVPVGPAPIQSPDATEPPVLLETARGVVGYPRPCVAHRVWNWRPVCEERDAMRSMLGELLRAIDDDQAPPESGAREG